MSKFDSNLDPYMIKLFMNYFTDRGFKIKNGSYFFLNILVVKLEVQPEVALDQ